MSRLGTHLIAQLLAVLSCTSASAQGFNERYPVSAEVLDLERQVMQLARDEAGRQRLTALREAWLQNRAAQCDEKVLGADTKSAALCAAGIDQDRIQSLRRTKFLMLVETPSRPAPAGLLQVRVAAALDAGGALYGWGVTPNGARALVIASDTLLIVDTFTGQTLRRTPIPRLENATLSFFPAGRVAAVTSRPVRGMRFFDTETGELLREFPDTYGPHQVMPDGRRVAYANEDKLLLYDVLANRAVSGAASHNKEHLVHIAVSGDGAQIATLTSAGTLTLWRVLPSDTSTEVAISRVGSVGTRIDQSAALGIAFSADGADIWTASNSHLAKWTVSGDTLALAEKVETGRLQGQTMRWVPGSDVIAVSGFDEKRGSYVLFYDAAKKAVVFSEVPRNYYPLISTSADGRLLFIGMVHELRRLDLPPPNAYSDAEKAFSALRQPPATVARLPDGPIRKDLPEAFQTEVIGVYEGGGQQLQSVQTSWGLRTARSVAIGVGKTARPLVLVLASYEPVIWDLKVAKTANLVRVLVSGYHESLVRGAAGVPVTRIGSAYSYTFGDQGSGRLFALIRQHTGRGVDGYQGSYRGIRFSVGAGAPGEVARTAPTLGLGVNVPSVPTTAEVQHIGRWEPRPPLVDIEKFGEQLYAVSAYTAEESALRLLVEAEIELVANRWLAQKLAGAPGRLPPGTPKGWEGMVDELRTALAPIAEAHLTQRARALKAAGLEGKAPFLLEYARLLREPKSRGDIRFSDGTTASPAGDQLSDIPDILAFHRTAAAKKWCKLWPELRAHAAVLAALHYRVDADPALQGQARDWEGRARALLKGAGGKVIGPGEWQAMMNDRLVFTLSGLDRFPLPLGTEIQIQALGGEVTTIRDTGGGIVISQREGRGLTFRVLDGRWQNDIARRLSAAELKQIDDALTARWVEKKGRWFAPLELEWDAYLAVSRRLRAARQVQEIYQSFKEQSNAAMARVWMRWEKQ